VPLFSYGVVSRDLLNSDILARFGSSENISRLFGVCNHNKFRPSMRIEPEVFHCPNSSLVSILTG
jgi:hypothetical protein